MSDLLLNAITSERYKAIFSSSLMLGIIGLSFGFLAMFFGTISYVLLEGDWRTVLESFRFFMCSLAVSFVSFLSLLPPFIIETRATKRIEYCNVNWGRDGF